MMPVCDYYADNHPIRKCYVPGKRLLDIEPIAMLMIHGTNACGDYIDNFVDIDYYDAGMRHL